MDAPLYTYGYQPLSSLDLKEQAIQTIGIYLFWASATIEHAVEHHLFWTSAALACRYCYSYAVTCDYRDYPGI